MPESDEIVSLLKAFVSGGHATEYFYSCGLLSDPTSVISISSSNCVFDLSSLTKALVTTPLIISLERAGLLKISMPLNQLKIPSPLRKFGDLTIEEILRHRSGLPAWRNFYVICDSEKEFQANEHIVERLSRIQVDVNLRGIDCYSDVGMILLWVCLTSNFAQTIEDLFDQYVCSEIGKVRAVNFGYANQIDKERVRFAASGYCALRRREIIGEVQDENCWALGGTSLHAGLFSSGLALQEYLFNLFSSDLGRDICTRSWKLVKPGNPGLLGWRQANDPVNAMFGRGLAMGHLGYTGSAFWIDYMRQSFVILLTNRLVAGRSSTAIKELRRSIFEKSERLSNRNNR